MRCPNCGTENVPGAPACARCNTPLAGPPQEGAPEWAPPPQGPGEWGAPGAPPPGPHPSGDWVPPGQPAPPVDQWGRPVAPQPSGEWGQPGAAPPGAPQAAWGQPGGPPSGGGWAPAGPGYGTGGYPGQAPRKDSTRRNLLVALGILQVFRRISAPEALAWSERTRDMFAGLYGDYAFGSLDDRCFPLPARDGLVG